MAVLAGALAESAAAAVTVSRAELSGSTLRLEGTATASRDITVDGVVMGRSDSGGRFRIERSGFTAPADCTVDVNDGSATPRTATLSGCTVSSPPLSSGPAAPAPTAPAAGASVTVPVTLDWSAVSDPSGIVGYNWEISASPAFSSLVTRDSTDGTVTQATVGGLAAGTYYWRVQAVNGALVQGAWSAARSFVVTGSGGGALAAPTLAPLIDGAQYHPMESFPVTWSAVTGASSYVVEASRDPAFPAPVEVRFDNIPAPRYGLTFDASLRGSWSLRVRAVDANGVAGAPSNVRTFTVSYDAPVGPAPTMVSPASGATLELPIRLDWNDVSNPQPSGYEAQVARDAGFTDVEVQISGQTSSHYDLLGLSAGTKYWRVRHAEGDSSPTTAAVTPWSEVRSFTVAGGQPRVASVSLGRSSAFSGTEQVVELQLSGPAPAGGAVVALSSSHPSAVPVPATVTVPAGAAFAQFRFTYGQVTEPTAATITASYAGSSAAAPITVEAPALKELGPSPNSITGGSPASGFVSLNGAAPAAGAVVSLRSSSPLAVTPASVTLPAGAFTRFFTIETSPVQSTTPVTITASWNGREVSQTLTLLPGVPPDSWTLERTTTTGSEGSSGRVAIAAVQSTDVTFTLTSSNPDVARMAPTVTIPAGSPHAGVLIHTTSAAAPTTVTLSVSGAGVTKTATLTVNPVASAPAAAPTLLAPASGARFGVNQVVPFDWSDVARAASYRIQVSASSSFTSTVADRTVTASQVGIAFPATGDRWWRVRAADAGGTPGAWSAARSFRVR